MKIGVSSEHAVAGRADDAGEVDDPAAADGDSRRRERGDLGPARSADSGAGRSRAAARQQRHAQGRHRVGARCDVGHGRRLHRHAEPAARGRAHRRRRRRAPSSRRWRSRRARRRRRVPRPAPPGVAWRDPPHRRRRRGRRGLPAADRRRRHQRRARPAADRREAAGGQHAAGHARRRGGARRARARPAGRRGRPDDLPAGDVHRDVARQPRTARC